MSLFQRPIFIMDLPIMAQRHSMIHIPSLFIRHMLQPLYPTLGLAIFCTMIT